jgi:hypothetical protein
LFEELDADEPFPVTRGRSKPPPGLRCRVRVGHPSRRQFGDRSLAVKRELVVYLALGASTTVVVIAALEGHD